MAAANERAAVLIEDADRPARLAVVDLATGDWTGDDDARAEMAPEPVHAQPAPE